VIGLASGTAGIPVTGGDAVGPLVGACDAAGLVAGSGVVGLLVSGGCGIRVGQLRFFRFVTLLCKAEALCSKTYLRMT
jgi:hypothetical protein